LIAVIPVNFSAPGYKTGQFSHLGAANACTNIAQPVVVADFGVLIVRGIVAGPVK
jgi:hypothetical protein